MEARGQSTCNRLCQGKLSHRWLHVMQHNHETNEQLSFKLSYSNYIILNLKKYELDGNIKSYNGEIFIS